MRRRAPEGCCPHCWQPHDYRNDEPCYPFVADERRMGDPDGDGPVWTTDRFESFILDATNPNQDTRRGAHGFQIAAAKAIVAAVRSALADGTLALADVAGADPGDGDDAAEKVG